MAKQTQPTQKNQDQSGSPVSNAGGSCIEAERAAGKNTVLKPAGRQPTESEGSGGQPANRNSGPCHGSIETQQDGRNGHFYIPAGFNRNCDQCDREYVAKRSTSKYCSGACRKRAFDARQSATAENGRTRP